MKKLLCFTLALVLCFAVACPVFATGEVGQDFVPSITYKEYPEVVVGEDGIIGEVRDENGEHIDYIYEPCLLITPYAKVNESKLIPEAAKQMLLYVYQELNNGRMQLPAKKLSDKLEANDLVVRELFDATWLCSDHPEMVAPKGVVFDVTFRVNIDKDQKLYVMTYKNGEWNPIVNVKNNGNGTVTCTFEDLCPVAFIVEKSSLDPTGDTIVAELASWAALMLVAAAALVCVVALRRREQMN